MCAMPHCATISSAHTSINMAPTIEIHASLRWISTKECRKNKTTCRDGTCETAVTLAVCLFVRV